MKAKASLRSSEISVGILQNTEVFCALASSVPAPLFLGVSITIEIPREIAEALPGPPALAELEVRKELALALFARGTLTSAQVCSWLGLTRWEGEELLAKRGVPRPYTTDELAAEMRNARHGQ